MRDRRVHVQDWRVNTKFDFQVVTGQNPQTFWGLSPDMPIEGRGKHLLLDSSLPHWSQVATLSVNPPPPCRLPHPWELDSSHGSTNLRISKVIVQEERSSQHGPGIEPMPVYICQKHSQSQSVLGGNAKRVHRLYPVGPPDPVHHWVSNKAELSSSSLINKCLFLHSSLLALGFKLEFR